MGRIDPDVTACCLEDRPLEAGLADPFFDSSGRVALCPAFAPFERVARAKTPEAAQGFERLVETVAGEFDQVLVDTPPVAANQSVAAVTGADRRVLVTPDTRRGADALPRMADRLDDVGPPADLELANRETGTVEGAGAAVEEGPEDVGDAPAVLGGEEFALSVAEATESVFGVEVDLGERNRSLRDRLS